MKRIYVVTKIEVEQAMQDLHAQRRNPSIAAIQGLIGGGNATLMRLKKEIEDEEQALVERQQNEKIRSFETVIEGLVEGYEQALMSVEFLQAKVYELEQTKAMASDNRKLADEADVPVKREKVESVTQFKTPEKTEQPEAKERVALTIIEQVLNIQLIRNFKVLDFYIDGYDAINRIAYEFYEEHQKVDDQQRQLNIEKTLDCTFVRIKV
jgi:hypothetical protein